MTRTSKTNKRFRRKATIYTVLLSALFLDIALMALYIKKNDLLKEELTVYSSEETFVSDNTQDTLVVNTQKTQRPIVAEIVSSEDINALFVGDSRTVGLKMAVSRANILAENGTKYDYLVSLEENIKNKKSDCIIIGFGVNDPEKVDKYIEYANRLSDELSIPIYFLTVNPTDGSRSKLNDKIDRFNDLLKENAGKYSVIDTNTHLKNIGFKTVDGIHYDENTYIQIYNYVMIELSKIEGLND